MDIEEAKFVLAVLRPGMKDPADPKLLEALELAKYDPELKRWMADQSNFDQMISGKLSEIESPPGLRDSIIECTNASLSQDRTTVSKRAIGLIAAASAVMAVVFALAPFGGKSETGYLSEFRSAAIAEIESLKKLDYLSPDQVEIRRWLKSHAGTSDFETPVALEKLATAGCHLFDWEGNRVSLICFDTDSGESRRLVHLIVVDRDLFPGLNDAELKITAQKEWASAVWRDHSQTYLLASKGDEARIRRLIESG